MRLTPAILVLFIFGCESEAERRERAVIEWAREYGLLFHVGTMTCKIGEVRDDFDYDSWWKKGLRLPDVEDILIRLLKTNDQRLDPVLAVRGLRVVGSKKSIPILMRLADSPRRLLAKQAITTLGFVPDRASVHFLREIILKGDLRTDGTVFFAAWSLCMLDPASALDTIKEAIRILDERAKHYDPDSRERRSWNSDRRKLRWLAEWCKRKIGQGRIKLTKEILFHRYEEIFEFLLSSARGGRGQLNKEKPKKEGRKSVEPGTSK